MLQAAPLLCGAGLLARGQGQAPFSRFTDVAATAGLTHPIPYGAPDKATYILEVMGGGCAFFDYDNDGWMDVLVVAAGTKTACPQAVAPGCTTTIVTEAFAM